MMMKRRIIIIDFQFGILVSWLEFNAYTNALISIHITTNTVLQLNKRSNSSKLKEFYLVSVYITNSIILTRITQVGINVSQKYILK